MTRSELIAETNFSKSQFYQWLEGVRDRKKREPKLVSEEVACAAVGVIGAYPHFSGVKGQTYMIYHQSGYIPQHVYKMLKKIVRKLIFQEASNRGLLPERTSYEHERPEKPGEIWAEDFTQIKVTGIKLYVSLLIDVASTYYLGSAASYRADDKLVEVPVIQALDHNEGCGPKRFLLSDNGSQYVDSDHGELLEKSDIVQKRIPACIPEYNGSIECGVKEFKNVFYNVWAEMETKGTDKEKNLLERVRSAVSESTRRLNFEIPRPSLRGVTPYDVHYGLADERMKRNIEYREREMARKEVKPWSKGKWQVVKEALFKPELSNLEVMTKFCFFLKRPLRKLAQLLPEGVLGNSGKFLSDFS